MRFRGGDPTLLFKRRDTPRRRILSPADPRGTIPWGQLRWHWWRWMPQAVLVICRAPSPCRLPSRGWRP